MDWKFIKNEFNKRFNASKKKYELQERYDYLEGRRSTKNLTNEEKELVINFRKERKTFHSIAQELQRSEDMIKNYYYREYKKLPKRKNHEICEPVKLISKNKFKSPSFQEIRIDQNLIYLDEFNSCLESEDRNLDFLDSDEI
jgi:DNA polymerase III delta prime subunit